MESKSTHRAEVVPVRPEKHPNADLLSVCMAHGYSVVIRSSDWEGIPLGVYLPPDSVVDVSRPEFAFLADQAKTGKARIKAKRLRGIPSFGLLIPAPVGAKEGDDLTEALGVKHFEPVLTGGEKGHVFLGGEVASPPKVETVKYDLEAFRRYHYVFTPGEPVQITEKLDGTSFRVVYCDNQFYCGSRNEWKKEFPDYFYLTVEYLTERGFPLEKANEIVERKRSQPKQQNLYWQSLRQTPQIEKFCRDNPGAVLHGEIFGNVNSIKYGLPEGNRFAGFDIMRDGRWLDVGQAAELAAGYEIPWVPVIRDVVPYEFELVCDLAEGTTLVKDARAGTIREGAVVVSVGERWDARVGRVKLKAVSVAYLEKYR